MAYQMAFFAANSMEKVYAAIEAQKVQYPAYVFIREDGSDNGRLGFVDQGNVLKLIDGEESKSQVIKVNVLPEIGDTEVLYILDGIVYTFNGTEYKPQFVDNTAELETLDARVTANEEKIAKLESLSTQHARVKYEIASKPEGTLVDYFDKEIRVMCPANTEWVKQSVGAGGDANSYYMTFKTYVPNEDVVGYIEHLGDQVDSEILTDLKTDEYGRRYQPTWLALAKYDESTDTWTYHGTTSTTEKYVGWDYQIDWYNEEGVMIESDSIRINLSNEDCHSMIEPYYISKMTSEITALKEAVDDLGTNSGSTFIELE